MRKVLTVVGLAILVVIVLAIVGTGFVISRFGGAPVMMRGFGLREFAFGGAFGLAWLGLVVRLLFWGLIIGGVILLAGWVASYVRQPAMATPAQESPLDIIKMRLAKGEITKEQYDQLKQDLG